MQGKGRRRVFATLSVPQVIFVTCCIERTLDDLCGDVEGILRS